MNNFKPGDNAFSFIGEKLCHFKVKEIIDEKRLTGETNDETFCVYSDYCYRTKEEAIAGMMNNIYFL